MTRGSVEASNYTEVDQQRQVKQMKPRVGPSYVTLFRLGNLPGLLKRCVDWVVQAMFQARKNTVLRKAMELAVLCPDCSVGLIVFDASSRLYQYSSVNMDSLLQRYLSSATAFEQHDTAELLQKSYRRVDEDPMGSEEAAHCARSKRQRLATNPHGATEHAGTSQMFGSTSHRQNGTAPVDTQPHSGSHDFISRERYPLSPRSNAAFLAIASAFETPHSPEVAVIFESSQSEQVFPSLEHDITQAGAGNDPVTQMDSLPTFAATQPTSIAAPTDMDTSNGNDQPMQAAVTSDYLHPHPAPLIVMLDTGSGNPGLSNSDAGCRPLAGTNSADVLLGLAMDLATPDSGTLGINWPSPHAGSASLPFSRSGLPQPDTFGGHPACSGQPEGMEYASEDSMDEGEGVELDGSMFVQGRGMSRAPQEDGSARAISEG